MTIHALRAKKKVVAIGIAFAAQEIPKFPPRHARRLDLVLTERETIVSRDVKRMRILLSATLSWPLEAHHRDRAPAGPGRRLGSIWSVINGESAAGGFGITESHLQELIDAGADAVTLGNHAWDQREALVFIEARAAAGPPDQYAKGTPGRGAAWSTPRTASALVINAMGRIFMDAMDDPFAAIDHELTSCALGKDTDAVIVDMHCEATSEKQSMAYFCDGRASLVVGTHTHVPTADHRILAGRTAFVSDVGMTGDFDSCIGMNKDEPLNRFLRKLPGGKFEPAGGSATLCGIAVETDGATVLAPHVGAVRVNTPPVPIPATESRRILR